MTTAIFTTLKSIVPEFVGFLKEVLTTLLSIFYDTTNAVMTDFGVVFLIGVVASLVFWGLGWVSRLLKMKN